MRTIKEDELLQDIVDEFELPTDRVVAVVVGWAANLPPELVDPIDQVVREALVPALDEVEAIVLDGGTDAGVMRMLGRGFRERGSDVVPIGIAPETKICAQKSQSECVPSAPFHRVIATPGIRWGDELEFMAGFADRASGEPGVVVVVVGGGSGTQAEYQLAIRRGWPILVLSGSGGFADEVAASELLPDNVAVVDVSSHALVRRYLKWVGGRDEAVRDAWQRSFQLGAYARTAKPRFKRIRNTVLVLGVVTTGLGLSYPYVEIDWLRQIVQAGLVLLPVLSAAILSWISRRRTSQRWVSARTAAEAFKREIYRFRAEAGVYEGGGKAWLLANRLSVIEGRLADEIPAAAAGQTTAKWPPQSKSLADSRDELLGPVAPQQYLEQRLAHQLRFHSEKIGDDDRAVARRLTIVMGSSILAALVAAQGDSLEPLIAVAAVIAASGAAVASWLAYDQLEQLVQRMASTAVGLQSVRRRWLAMDPDERVAACAEMVGEAEEIMEAENADWAKLLKQSQYMFDAQQSRGGV